VAWVLSIRISGILLECGLGIEHKDIGTLLQLGLGIEQNRNSPDILFKCGLAIEHNDVTVIKG
jgi:hypothetical protein